MFVKEVKSIFKNPIYYMILILPIILTLFMSEGTKNYLSREINNREIINTSKEVVIYDGKTLDSKEQFAVSELNFMLLMVSVLAGLNLFEERRLHIWDRVVQKNKFYFIKFLSHFIFSIIMVILNIAVFKFLLKIDFNLKSVFIFISVAIISINFGLFVGIIVKTRAAVSNTIMMIVMLMGYFGGALSLSSVLENTKFMNILIYISPLTFANKIIFKNLINISCLNEFIVWILLLIISSTLFSFYVQRRIKNGSIL